MANISINHGDINTINGCISLNVPMIIIPGNQLDQNRCAARCFYHGIAIQASPNNLESCISDGLANTILKHSMEKYHDLYQDYQRSRRLEKIVSEVIENKN